MREIRPLRADDDRSLFSCGQPDLDRFFREIAGQHQFKKHISATHVLVSEEAIAGFVTLHAAAMTAVDLAFEPHKWPRQHLPVLRLARLATDQRFRDQGLGRDLTTFAMRQSIEMRDRFGCVALVVDPKPDAVGFYAKLGFIAIGAPPTANEEAPGPMLLPTDKIARAIERARSG